MVHVCYIDDRREKNTFQCSVEKTHVSDLSVKLARFISHNGKKTRFTYWYRKKKHILSLASKKGTFHTLIYKVMTFLLFGLYICHKKVMKVFQSFFMNYFMIKKSLTILFDRISGKNSLNLVKGKEQKKTFFDPLFYDT